MSVSILFIAAVLVGGAAVGYLNGWITTKLLGGTISVNRVMLVNLVHLVIAAAYLSLVLIAARLCRVDAAAPLLVGAGALVLVPILMAALRKSQK